MYAIATLRETFQSKGSNSNDQIGSVQMRMESIATLNLTGLESRQVETILVGMILLFLSSRSLPQVPNNWNLVMGMRSVLKDSLRIESTIFRTEVGRSCD